MMKAIIKNLSKIQINNKLSLEFVINRIDGGKFE